MLCYIPVLLVYLVGFPIQIAQLDKPPRFEVYDREGTASLFREIGKLAGVDSLVHIVLKCNFTRDLIELDKLCQLPHKILENIPYTIWKDTEEGLNIKVNKNRTYLRYMAEALFQRCFSLITEFNERKEALTISYRTYGTRKPNPLPPYRHQLKDVEFGTGSILAQETLPPISPQMSATVSTLVDGVVTSTMSAAEVVKLVNEQLFPPTNLSPVEKARQDYQLLNYSIPDVERAMLLDAAWRSNGAPEFQNWTARAKALKDLKLPYVFALPNSYNTAWHDSDIFWNHYPDRKQENGAWGPNTHKKYLKREYIINNGVGTPWRTNRESRETIIADEDFPPELLFLIRMNFIRIIGPRQVLIGFGLAALVCSVTALFTYNVVSSMVSGSAGHVRVLNDFEARLTVQENSLKLINATVSTLTNVTALLASEVSELQMLQLVECTISAIEHEYARIFRGMNAMIQRRLSPDLTKQESLQQALTELREYSLTKNYVLAIDQLQDIYNCEVSMLAFENTTIALVVHIPIMRLDSQLKLFEIIPVPVSMGHSSNYLYSPSPTYKYLAVNSDESRYKLLTKEDFETCNNFGSVYFCKNQNVFDRQVMESCEVALYRNEIAVIKEKCTFLVKPQKDYAVQLAPNKFLLYFRQTVLIRLKCIPDTGASPQSQKVGPGLIEVMVPASCSLLSPSFTCEGQLEYSAFIGEYEPRNFSILYLLLEEGQQITDATVVQNAITRLEGKMKKEAKGLLSREGLNFKTYNFPEDKGFFEKLEEAGQYIVWGILGFATLIALLYLCSWLPPIKKRWPSQSERRYQEYAENHNNLIDELKKLHNRPESEERSNEILSLLGRSRHPGVASEPSSPNEGIALRSSAGTSTGTGGARPSSAGKSGTATTGF